GRFYRANLSQIPSHHFVLHENRWSRDAERLSSFSTLPPKLYDHPTQNLSAKYGHLVCCSLIDIIAYGPYQPENQYWVDPRPPAYLSSPSSYACRPNRFPPRQPVFRRNQRLH